jgi:ATP-dependent DNA helicase RecG
VEPVGLKKTTPEVLKMLQILDGEMTRQEIMQALALRDEKHFREDYQQAAIATKLIEMTIPDKPNSCLQKYRLTEKGRKRKLEG